MSQNKTHVIKWADEENPKSTKTTKVIYKEYDGTGNPPETTEVAKGVVYGVDGRKQEFELPLPINYWKYYLYSCFPCFIPPQCNAKNSHRYCLFLFSCSFLLSFVQFVMLIVELSLDGFDDPKNNWTLGPTAYSMNVLGCKNAYEMKYNYELWRLITPIFLHGGIIHLICNLSMQLRMGMIIERRWGAIRWVLIYFLSGIIANCYSVMCKPDSLGVGASGALLGIYGGFVVDIVLNRKKFDIQTFISLMVNLLVGILFIFVFSFVPGIDFVAHIFGFISGCILGLAFLCHQNEWINKRIWLKITIWVSSGCYCLFSLVLSLLLLYLDVLDV